jgi:DNA-binding transcriptional LysR family regulator
MTPSVPWDFYRSCLAVLRHGSLSAAARSIGVTQPTIGRHIAALEELLGIPLFTRSPAGLSPTQAAVALLPLFETMESASLALQRTASNASGQATVRITASEVMGVRVLPPMLAGLREQHPGLDIELSLSNQLEDLLRHDADIAVRMVRPGQQALLARQIGRVEIGLFAHRDYLARHGMPQNFEELRTHTLIGFDRDDGTIRGAGLPDIMRERGLFAFRSDNQLAQIAAVEAGIGIGGIQIPLARANPGLVAVNAGFPPFPLEVWLVMHEDLRESKPVRAAFDYLAGALGRYLAGGPAVKIRRLGAGPFRFRP